MLEEYIYKNYKIVIKECIYPENPRYYFTSLVQIRTFFKNNRNIDEIKNFTDDELFKLLENNEESDYLAFLIRGYSHGGISLSLSNEYPYNDHFDSGIAGIAIVKKSELEHVLFYRPQYENIENVAKHLISIDLELLNNYFSGSVYDIFLYKDDRVIENFNNVYEYYLIDNLSNFGFR